MQELAARWSVFVFAPMAFDAIHARKHAVVESCRRLGFEATYVEPPNSTSPYHTARPPTLNRGGVRIAPPATAGAAADGTPVLAVPKKLSIGPLRVHVGRRLQERLQGAWLRAFFARRASLGSFGADRQTLAIVASPRWEPLLRGVAFDRVVFDHTDALHVLRGRLDDAALLTRRAALVQRSACVWAVSQGLADEIRTTHPDAPVRVVPNGVDVAHFDKHRWDAVPELESAPRPIAGFLGSVASWVDVERLRACAEAYPDWTLVVAGPIGGEVDVTALRRLPNVRLLGRLPYDRVPAVMQCFDVALMPFRPGALSQVANPVTLYELLALGKPVVCTPMPQLEALADLIYMSDRDFVADLARAREEAGDELAARRREVGVANGWDRLVERAVGEALTETRVSSGA
jgi:glycosyltransferase involved in cell wall biosynthesis